MAVSFDDHSCSQGHDSPTNARSCLREVMGLPVLDISSGKEMGVVKGCLFHPVEPRLLCLIVGERGQDKAGTAIPIESVRSIGSDAVTVEDMVGVDEVGLGVEAISILGKRVFSQGGREIGIIRDLSIDCENGGIVGYEVSESLLLDIISGRRVIPSGNIITEGETVVIPDDDHDQEAN